MINKTVSLFPESIERLQMLCGSLNENLVLIENALDIEISGKNFDMLVGGNLTKNVDIAIEVLEKLYSMTWQNNAITAISEDDIFILLNQISNKYAEDDTGKQIKNYLTSTEEVTLLNGKVKSRTLNQSLYLNAIKRNDVTIGVGPAGTGKSYLAIAVALDYLLSKKVDKIILTRPAVESGESLGFLPGEIDKKLEPYLKPLYDAISEMIGGEKLKYFMERGIIEIAPLAYMRGRTFKKSFVILDEAQNTTKDQMKLCLTRLGYLSKIVVNGDLTQIDLNDKRKSGLLNAVEVLENINDSIKIHYFDSSDIMRHRTTTLIVNAYNHWQEQQDARDKIKEKKITTKDLLKTLKELLNKDSNQQVDMKNNNE